ncbi:MAG: ribosome-associated translation inhibitor RaiA [Patescibacteria group bacterium]
MIKNVRGVNMELSNELSLYIDNKLEYLEKHLAVDSEDGVTVDFSVGRESDHHKNGEVYKADMNLQIGGTLLRAEAHDEDLYATIDKIKEEMAREIKSFKEKRGDLEVGGNREAKKELDGEE